MIVSTNYTKQSAGNKNDRVRRITIQFWECIDIVDSPDMDEYYRKIYNIRGTKSQNSNDYPLVLLLSLPNLLKTGVK